LSIAAVPFPGHADLVAVLAALAPKAQARALGDLDQITELPVTSGRLIVDADHLATEDIGWVRRILAARPGWTVVCTGRDAGARNARSLMAFEGARWLGWPPSLEDLRALAAPPRASALAASAPSASAEPAPGFAREHVAVLADISQRLELAFAALREGGRLPEADLESPSVELRRLLRFTRTLSCLVSPPPRGDEKFDLAALIDEQLAALTLRARKGPRFQPRAPQEGRSVEFVVQADRAALALAFESLLQLARHCAGQGETVRVVYAVPQPGELSVSIDFPAGPLERLSSEQLADPAVLRERLPELWPSDLSAAAAIIASQGGGLQIQSPASSQGPGQISLVVRLPGVRAAPPSPPSARQAPTARSGPDDPFA
jgi:hypothetical protein